MHRIRRALPTLIVFFAIIGLLIYGPIAQLPHYHEFADQHRLFGIPAFVNVLSNLGFALVGIWGYLALRPLRNTAVLQDGWDGYRLFLIALVLTAAGSSYYHLAPNDSRLIWDRLPIALACAGLLAAIRSETARQSSDRATTALALVGAGSVAWWYLTGLEGPGDLRPYLLLQVLPLVLIPIWQYNGRAPRSQRLAFAAAIVLYVLAKLAEIGDHAIFAELGWISGHTVKHLLASAAAATIVFELVARVRRDTPAALQNEKREYIATARVNASSRAKA